MTTDSIATPNVRFLRQGLELIETLGDAYCSDLRRTAVGPFRVEEAGRTLSLERVGELVPAVAEALR